MYAQSIEAALIKLTQYPEFGRQRDELYKKARSFPIEKHIVFYKISDTGIDIARILHQHIDSSKHF
ncbi:MAG: type II toxin-antitoxin system RelE/ParE family toxin [Cycloclasticus sp.]|nr:type II toxin-antitoxin system RelE/ParE family toxin [Cycloclasticus sp.]